MLILKLVDLFLDTSIDHNPQFDNHFPRELNQLHEGPTSAVRRGNPAAGRQYMSWGDQKKARVAILISDKIDFKQRL